MDLGIRQRGRNEFGNAETKVCLSQSADRRFFRSLESFFPGREQMGVGTKMFSEPTDLHIEGGNPKVSVIQKGTQEVGVSLIVDLMPLRKKQNVVQRCVMQP